MVARNKELDALFERLYEDNVSGKIDDSRFYKMSKRYEQEQGENEKKIKLLRNELRKSEGQKVDVDEFVQNISKSRNVTEVTQRMVYELIDHIDVYLAEKDEGVSNQRIVIYYNCIGAFEVPNCKR